MAAKTPTETRREAIETRARRLGPMPDYALSWTIEGTTVSVRMLSGQVSIETDTPPVKLTSPEMNVTNLEPHQRRAVRDRCAEALRGRDVVIIETKPDDCDADGQINVHAGELTARVCTMGDDHFKIAFDSAQTRAILKMIAEIFESYDRLQSDRVARWNTSGLPWPGGWSPDTD